MTHYEVGPLAPEGTSTCTYMPGGVICGRPAHAHALLSIVPPVSGAFCTQHWQTACHTMRFVDFHAFTDHCNLPGSRWLPSTHNTRGTCQIPHDLTDDIERFANQPTGARP